MKILLKYPWKIYKIGLCDQKKNETTVPLYGLTESP